MVTSRLAASSAIFDNILLSANEPRRFRQSDQAEFAKRNLRELHSPSLQIITKKRNSMFQRIEYGKLNPRQQENYNFQKVAGRLADYGFNCLKLNDDWQSADFLAVHVDGNTCLKVQLKGRLTLDNKYCGKDVYVAFLIGNECYVYPHDTILKAVLARGNVSETRSWADDGKYTWRDLPLWARELLNEYRV